MGPWLVGAVGGLPVEEVLFLSTYALLLTTYSRSPGRGTRTLVGCGLRDALCCPSACTPSDARLSDTFTPCSSPSFCRGALGITGLNVLISSYRRRTDRLEADVSL